MTMTPSRKFELIHETLLVDDNVLNISELCELAGVSRSGFIPRKRISRSFRESPCSARAFQKKLRDKI